MKYTWFILDPPPQEKNNNKIRNMARKDISPKVSYAKLDFLLKVL